MTMRKCFFAVALISFLIMGCPGTLTNPGPVTSPSGGDALLSYSVSVNVSGLSSGTLVLQNNGGDDLSITANGTYAFSTKIADGGAYDVTVKTQPSSGLFCIISTGSGTIAGTDITTVSGVCQVTGAIDSTFNSGSMITIGSNNSDTVNCIAFDNQKRILIAGQYNNQFALLRYNENGTIDTTWATSGIFTALSDGSGAVYVHQDTMGNYVIVGGTNFKNTGTGQFAVVYVLSSTDASVLFSNSTLVAARDSWAIRGIQLPNNDIYVTNNHPGDTALRISKWTYSSNAYQLDTSWGGGDGIVDDLFATTGARRPDRIIYDSTNSSLIISSNYQFANFYNMDGAYQTKVTTPVCPVTVLENGALSCIGSLSNDIQVFNFSRTSPWAAYTGLDTDGTLDGVFLVKSTGWISGSSDTMLYDVVKDNLGNTIIVGVVRDGTSTYNGVIGKIKSDYTPDTSFDGDGLMYITDVFKASSHDWLKAVAVDAQGRYVVAGYADNSVASKSNDIFISRIVP